MTKRKGHNQFVRRPDPVAQTWDLHTLLIRSLIVGIAALWSMFISLGAAFLFNNVIPSMREEFSVELHNPWLQAFLEALQAFDAFMTNPLVWGATIFTVMMLGLPRFLKSFE